AEKVRSVRIARRAGAHVHVYPLDSFVVSEHHERDAGRAVVGILWRILEHGLDDGGAICGESSSGMDANSDAKVGVELGGPWLPAVVDLAGRHPADLQVVGVALEE